MFQESQPANNNNDNRKSRQIVGSIYYLGSHCPGQEGLQENELA
jgi:hypothetical protein